MNKTILLVDDDQRLRSLLKDYLSEKNFKVYTLQDFKEAKETGAIRKETNFICTISDDRGEEA